MTEFVDTVVATDPKTVTFTLTKAQPRFHYYFTIGIVDEPLRIVPKHVWEGQDAGTFKNNPPIYTGPYVLNQANPDQFMQVWEKAPNYWNKANMDPAPQYVIFRQRLEPDAEAQEFANGNVDIPSLPYLNMQAVRDQFDNWIELQFNDPCPRGIWLNNDSPSGLFKTAEGRQAISVPPRSRYHRQHDLAAALQAGACTPGPSGASTTAGPTRRSGPSTRSSTTWSEAAELLDAAGATLDGDRRKMNGEDINLTIITPVQVGDPEYQIATLLADALDEVGISAEVQSLPGTGHPDAFQLGEYDISSHWLCGVALDPNQLYEKFLTADYKPVGERVAPRSQRDARPDPGAERRRRAAPERQPGRRGQQGPLRPGSPGLPGEPAGHAEHLHHLPVRLQPGILDGLADPGERVQRRRELVGPVPLHHRRHQAGSGGSVGVS